MYHSVSFGTFTIGCNRCLYEVLKYFHHPYKTPCTPCTSQGLSQRQTGRMHVNREIYFVELAHTSLEPGKHEIRRVGWQAKDQRELVLQFRSTGQSFVLFRPSADQAQPCDGGQFALLSFLGAGLGNWIPGRLGSWDQGSFFYPKLFIR